MAKKTETKAAAENVVAEAGNAKLVMQSGEQETGEVQKAGDKGPKSSLETGEGSPTGATAGGNQTAEGNRGSAGDNGKQTYSVQHHSDEGGVEVSYIDAESGDDAANQVLKAAKYRGTSIRGVDVASAPDPNSMGGEREASIMFYDAEHDGTIINTLGTEANAEAHEKLRRKDVKDLGE